MRFTFRKGELSLVIGIYILVAFFFLNSVMSVMFSTRINFFLICLATLFIMFGTNAWGTKARKKWKFMIPWIIIGIISLVHNADLKHDVYTRELCMLIYLVSGVFLCTIDEWQHIAFNAIKRIGSIHVIATYFFLFFQPLYTVMYKFYGYYPVGSNAGKTGFCAGITEHYSSNGLYVAIVFLVVGCSIITDSRGIRRSNNIIKEVIIFIALLLTNKRAMVLFSIVAIVISYLVFNRKKVQRKYITLISILLALITIITILYEFFPEIFAVFLGRFVNSNSGSISSGRVEILWPFAIKLFKEHPFTGIGWMGYQYEYFQNLYQGSSSYRYQFLSPHNVYLQILCENGIVGLTCLIWAIVSTVKKIVKAKKMSTDFDKGRKYLAVSFGVFSFFILYCLTGCCLYDQTFFILMISLTMGGALSSYEKTK